MEIRTLEKIANFDSGRKAVLCTQVEWSGSVPRKDYPMMLVEENGEIIGTIGGGASEHSVINLAKNIINTGKPILKQFDMTNQDVTKSGSVCGGNTTILIEPYSIEIRNILRSIVADKTHSNNILITKISSQNDLIIERTKITKDYDSVFPKKIVYEIDVVREKNKSKSINYNDELFLIQNIGDRPILHIFGAGHVGKAVADLAHFIELDTKIYDERKDMANKERFQFTSQIINNDISRIIKGANIAQSDYVLVATRGHQHDFELMRWLLNVKIDYLSLMSSKKKWQLLSQALINDGFKLDQIHKVHSPVGLDIGSETVPEIAISIIAEIVNHYRCGTKSASSLSNNNE
ncbi:MAG: XdhC/CoxI family protein [Candidatus Marinimicrobia bacterium]|nr:XdhC/CoxI family protein [Candidatus Neomarinimicrobiota bacterium]